MLLLGRKAVGQRRMYSLQMYHPLFRDTFSISLFARFLWVSCEILLRPILSLEGTEIRNVISPKFTKFLQDIAASSPVRPYADGDIAFRFRTPEQRLKATFAKSPQINWLP